MSKEKRFLRQCCVCKEYKNKNDLLRLTKDYQTNEIKLNINNEVNGRSVYVCKSEQCINTALKKKKFENSLKTKLSENEKELLSTVLKD